MYKNGSISFYTSFYAAIETFKNSFWFQTSWFILRTIVFAIVDDWNYNGEAIVKGILTSRITILKE